MTQRRSVSVVVWGVLSVLAGALMTEGGIMEVIAYWPQGQTSNVVVGAFGAVVSAILLVSGVVFLALTAAVAAWARRIREHFAPQDDIVDALQLADEPA